MLDQTRPLHDIRYTMLSSCMSDIYISESLLNITYLAESRWKVGWKSHETADQCIYNYYCLIENFLIFHSVLIILKCRSSTNKPCVFNNCVKISFCSISNNLIGHDR